MSLPSSNKEIIVQESNFSSNGCGKHIDRYGNPKIYYRGYIAVKDIYDVDGEEEEISMLQEDLLKLINE